MVRKCDWKILKYLHRKIVSVCLFFNTKIFSTLFYASQRKHQSHFGRKDCKNVAYFSLVLWVIEVPFVFMCDLQLLLHCLPFVIGSSNGVLVIFRDNIQHILTGPWISSWSSKSAVVDQLVLDVRESASVQISKSATLEVLSPMIHFLNIIECWWL